MEILRGRLYKTLSIFKLSFFCNLDVDFYLYFDWQKHGWQLFFSHLIDRLLIHKIFPFMSESFILNLILILNFVFL